MKEYKQKTKRNVIYNDQAVLNIVKNDFLYILHDHHYYITSKGDR